MPGMVHDLSQVSNMYINLMLLVRNSRCCLGEHFHKLPSFLFPLFSPHNIKISLLICSTPFRARDNFEKVKGTYGAASCYLLQLNSRQPGTKTEDIPDPWSHFIHSPTADNVSNMCGLVLKWSLLSQFLHERNMGVEGGLLVKALDCGSRVPVPLAVEIYLPGALSPTPKN